MSQAPGLKSSFVKTAFLQKGQGVNLTELEPALHKVVVALGWDAPKDVNGFPVDVDASVFLLTREGKVKRDTDFIFYNQLEAHSGAVQHLGDCITGDAEGDDEAIDINLEGLPFDIDKIAVAISIHNAEDRQQTFGLIQNAYVRILNKDTGDELAHFDLTESAPDDNAVIFGELTRDGVSWHFKAIGQGTNGGLYRLARDFGVNVAAS